MLTAGLAGAGAPWLSDDAKTGWGNGGMDATGRAAWPGARGRHGTRYWSTLGRPTSTLPAPASERGGLPEIVEKLSRRKTTTQKKLPGLRRLLRWR